MRLIIILIWLIFTSSIIGDDVINITTATTNVTVLQPVILDVSGTTPQETKELRYSIEPNTGYNIEAFETKGGKAIILFTPTKAGTYKISLMLNDTHSKWKNALLSAYTQALTAKVDAVFLNDLLRISNTAKETYPSKEGSIVISVVGATPNPITPVQPIQISGITYIVIFRVAETLDEKQATVLRELREWSDKQSFSKVRHYEFTPELKDQNNIIHTSALSFYQKIPTGQQLPYVFIAKLSANSKTSTIVDSFPLPMKVEDIIKKVELNSK